VVIFWKFSEKIKNSFLAYGLAFPIQFLRFANRRNTQKQNPVNKVGSGRFGVEIRGERSVGWVD